MIQADPITCTSDTSYLAQQDRQRPATTVISERVTESEWPQPIQQSHKATLSLPYTQTAKSQILFTTAPISVTNTTWSYTSHPSSTSSPQSFVTSRSPDDSPGEEETTTTHRPPDFTAPPPSPPDKEGVDLSTRHDTNLTSASITVTQHQLTSVVSKSDNNQAANQDQPLTDTDQGLVHT